jgi:hypothetical protein
MKKIMKINNKKAVSLMISYVLLVTIAIIMSIIVFTYLKTIANVEPVIDCKEGTSIVVEDYSCEEGKITLTIRNNGRFNVDGFIATFGGKEFQEPSAKLDIAEGQEATLAHFKSGKNSIPFDPPRFLDPTDPKKDPLIPGEIIEVNFTNSEGFKTIYNLKVQPYIIDEETELRIACGGEINKQDVEDCQI